MYNKIVKNEQNIEGRCDSQRNHHRLCYACLKSSSHVRDIEVRKREKTLRRERERDRLRVNVSFYLIERISSRVNRRL